MQYRFNLHGFYGKVLDDIDASRTPEGMVPSIAPEFVVFADGFENSPEWGSASIVSPWYIYKWYGDKDILERHYDGMKSYVDYLTTKAEGHIISYGLGDWFDLGPGKPGYSQLTSNGVTATAMYFYNASIMQQVASMLGRRDDEAKFSKLKNNIRESFNVRYYNPEGFYDRNSQTANAIALVLGLAMEENREVVLMNLVHDIKKGECPYCRVCGISFRT